MPYMQGSHVHVMWQLLALCEFGITTSAFVITLYEFDITLCDFIITLCEFIFYYYVMRVRYEFMFCDIAISLCLKLYVSGGN